MERVSRFIELARWKMATRCDHISVRELNWNVVIAKFMVDKCLGLIKMAIMQSLCSFNNTFFPVITLHSCRFVLVLSFCFFFFGSKRERQNESVYSQFVKWAYKFFLRIESNDVVIFHNFVQHNIFTVHLRVAPVQLNSKQWLHWIEHKIPAHCRHTASLEYFSRFVCLLMLVNV